MNKDAIVSFENFSFKYYFRNDWTINDLNLQISRGEFVVLTGPNGSGKSTICYGILGLIPNFYAGESKGKVITNQINVAKNPISVTVKNIGYIPQRVENTLITPYGYTELAFPLEYQEITEENLQKRILEISEELKIKNLLRKNLQEISQGEKQKIGFGSATIDLPEIIIADEPLANLDKKNRNRIMEILTSYKKQGKTVVISTNNYERFSKIASRIIHLENGTIIREMSQIKKNKAKIEKKTRKKESKIKETKETILEIKNLGFEYSDSFKLNSINLSISKGEIVGLVGDNGAGKTTFLKLLLGILKPKEGNICIHNQNFKDFKWKEITSIFGVVFQDPQLQFFTEDVISEIQFISKNLKKDANKELAFSLLQSFNLDKYKESNPISLSYGERKKLAFLSSIYHNPEILLLDEINAGLDDKSKKKITTHIKNLAEEGKSTILISHDLNWLNNVADRIYLFQKGELKLYLTTKLGGNFNV